MDAIAPTNLLLRTIRPDDQVHLLLWDAPSEIELRQLAFYNNALRVNYRHHLMHRVDPDDRFLTLHHHLDRELEAIRSMVKAIPELMVLLENLDCLITYLYTQPNSNITLFWSSLERIRKLDRPLWILLPSAIAPATWPEHRLIRIPT